MISNLHPSASASDGEFPHDPWARSVWLKGWLCVCNICKVLGIAAMTAVYKMRLANAAIARIILLLFLGWNRSLSSEADSSW